MAQTSLVDTRWIEAGERLIRALDELDFPVFAAFWQWQEEPAEWRLIIGTDVVTRHGPARALRQIQEVLSRAISSTLQPDQEWPDLARHFQDEGELASETLEALRGELTLRDITVVGSHDPRLDVLHGVPFTSRRAILPRDIVRAAPWPDGVYVYRNAAPTTVSGRADYPTR